jgi:ABC-2 type transport system ATP-binding protein
MKAIEIDRLCFRARRNFWNRAKTILDQVTLSVEQGEIFGFIGPNGAGKTTTIKALLGLLRPDSGIAKILGQEPRSLWVRGHLGFMPEQPYFPAEVSGIELVTTHARLAGLNAQTARHRGHEVLERVGLKDAENERLRTYSKGMLQRVGLAQALVAGPEIVILDEPMSGLDPLGRRDVRELMVELRARGTTIFFSTHILPDVEMICDRVGMLVLGRVRQIGALREMLVGATTAVEIVAESLAAEALAAVGIGARATRQQDGSVLVIADDVAAANRLLDRVREVGGTIRSVQPQRASLEHLYLNAASNRNEEAS